MAQPPTYNRQFSFSNFQSNFPSTPLPGTSADLELNTVKATLDAVLANLALIQRDDGDLANDSVGLDQLSSEVTVGFSVPTVWLTATAYSTSNTTFHGSGFYRCLMAHTSGVFATDLSALKWELIVDLSTIATVNATQVANTPAGNIASTTVQAALNELDSEKALLSHTHLASQISDSTTVGQNFLKAANLAAQKTLLGLGALAFLDSVPTTTLATTFLLTGVISPAALSGNTNDWAPTSFSTSSIIRLSCTSAFNLTGIAGGADGRVIVLHNIGATNTLSLVSASASSTAANRFTLPYTVHNLKPLESCMLMYDGTTARWRLIGRLRPETVAPSFQTVTATGAGTYTTPTDTDSRLPLYIRVKMVGAGGGGGAQATNDGAAGADTTVGSWTAIHGSGGVKGSTGTGGAGGTGGANSTGTLIRRIDGQNGGTGNNSLTSPSQPGGDSFFGGAGAPTAGAGAGSAAKANTGSGGSGASNGGGVNGGGGGGGEYVEFIITSPATSYAYSNGAKGAGGAAGTTAGGDGADGRIEFEAYWQ